MTPCPGIGVVYLPGAMLAHRRVEPCPACEIVGLRSALSRLVRDVDSYAAMMGSGLADSLVAQFFVREVGAASCIAHNTLKPGSHECADCPHDR